jgi:hypothetical protein
MAINVHQVTSEKRLESHDEQLMLIIPVVGRYITRRCCDRWVVVTRRGLLLIGPCSTAQRKIFLSYWASKPSPEQEPPKSLCSNMSVMTWCSWRPDAGNFVSFIFSWKDHAFERHVVGSRVEKISRMELSKNLGFSHFVFICEDLGDPLFVTSIYCGSLCWMRGSQLADYSWAFFERFSRLRRDFCE